MKASASRPAPAAIVFAAVPILALTAGIPFANRVAPLVFGLPFLLAYILAWIVLTPVFLSLAYRAEASRER